MKLTRKDKLEALLLLNETPVNFSLSIEELVRSKGIGYIEAILHYCERNSIELEYITALLTTNLKAKIELEAETLNLVKGKRERLDV